MRYSLACSCNHGWCLSSVFLLAAGFSFSCARRVIRKLVTGAHIIVHAVDFLELLNALESFLTKGSFVIKSMQGHSFEQIAEGNIEIFCERFENLYHALFHSYANLYTLHSNVTI